MVWEHCASYDPDDCVFKTFQVILMTTIHQ